jgi:hypothetical protein
MSIRSSVGAGIVVGLLFAAPAASAAPMVKARDACDPATFDAVLGAGACVDGGNVTFDSLIDRRSRQHRAQVPGAAAAKLLVVSRMGADPAVEVDATLDAEQLLAAWD